MITRFKDEYFFLSNFYPCRVRFVGMVYPTAEHAYQAAKTLDINERRKIRAAASPGAAKRLGRKVRLRSHWDEIKIDLMRIILFDKFARNDDLAKKLLATGYEELIEGNYWGDTFWGVYHGAGHNHLGKLLMEVRGQLR